ncbi:hypothetical protein KBI5_18490 [Frankia sp. KB5]|nr:hypothetical protein KBI5_18490 [Frankia sp. KB5]
MAPCDAASERPPGAAAPGSSTPPTASQENDGERRALSRTAAGSDGIFADVVLTIGGTFKRISPDADYRARRVNPSHADLFDGLVRRAATVQVLPLPCPG